MRKRIATLLSILLIVDLAHAQTIDVSQKKSSLPMYRPALLGAGPDALINRIDTKMLVAKGQKDAAVMFNCSVLKTGEIGWSTTYRGTADSKLLDQEVFARLRETKFVPAIYNHIAVDAIYYGTVTFAIVDGKPRLRIFSNQETEELKKENDFIGPQPFFGLESKFTGFHYPSADIPVMVKGSVEVKLKIDEKGNLQDISVLTEEPPFIGLGDAALTDLRLARFIPAFRNGKPVACEVTLPVFYVPKA
ncbi:MAG: Gram-negative bacterial TonB protein C-terminal [Verrucomicrobiota bacterium]